MTAAITLEDVCVRRDGNLVLENVSASIPKGSVTAIIGPNGAGKTSLLLAILRLLPFEGKIQFLRETGRRRPRVGYVPQRLDFDRGVPITVRDFLVMCQQRWPLWLGTTRRAVDNALKHLRRVQADRLIDRPLGALSGGELQRVQLALALQADPDIVLLDEPVSGVDVRGERLFCDMLEDVQRQSHFTMVMVSHDLSVVSRHARHVICINRTLQCEGPAPEVLSAENLSAIYGVHAGLVDHHGSGSHAHAGHHHCPSCPEDPATSPSATPSAGAEAT